MHYQNQEFKTLFDDLLAWADLRVDQNADVKPIIKRLRKAMEKAQRQLREARPSKKIRMREPNALDAIRDLRPDGPRKLWTALRLKEWNDRLRGAWLGRAAGCTLGVPVENWSMEAMERLARRGKMAFPPDNYWNNHPYPEQIQYGVSPMSAYLRDGIRAVPVDDDLTYTLLGLRILETAGPGFSTNDVAQAWLKYLPVACTAEAVTLENLRAGIPPSEAAEPNNPYQEWIGADIRSDPWAYAAPGWPEKAAEMAWRDAYCSHRGSGLYGAMFFAAAIAAAFAVDDPMEALRIGLTEIPKDSRLANDIQWALDLAPQLKDYRAARAAVDERFPQLHPVHTNNNACLTIFGLALGQRDFTNTIGITVAMGLDNDCTAATAGSLLGACIGIKNIPEHWWKPFRNTTHTYLRDHPLFKNSDIIQRFKCAAQNIWAVESSPDISPQ